MMTHRGLIFLLFAAVCSASCADINTVHQEWLDKGEKIYVGKLDSIYVRSGMYRVEIVGNTRYIRNATTCTVTFGDETLEYNLPDVVDAGGNARLLVPGLDRGSYYFDIATFDADGNRSVLTKVFGKVYGEEEGLLHLPKRIAEFVPKADRSLDLVWNDEEVDYTKLTYEREDGSMQEVEVPSDEKKTNVVSWKPGGKIRIESHVRESENDLDLIPLKEVEMAFPEELPKSILHFGVNSAMNLGSTEDWDLENGFTIEMQVRYSELGAYVQSVISAESESGGLILRNNNAKLEYYVHDGGWNGNFYDGLQVNTWYHYAIAYSPNGKSYLYINGELISSTPCRVLGALNPILQIGMSPRFSGQYLRGDVRHVSVWSDVRSAEEIKNDMLYGFDGDEEGLRAYWPLTINYGETEIPDNTGRHTAVLSDVTWIPDGQ